MVFSGSERAAARMIPKSRRGFLDQGHASLKKHDPKKLRDFLDQDHASLKKRMGIDNESDQVS